MSGILICDALAERLLIRFRYKDNATWTTAEPYTYGENTRGHLALSAWLVDGRTHDPTPPYWRLYLLDDMHDIQVLPDRFVHNRPGYNPTDKRFRRIHCSAARE